MVVMSLTNTVGDDFYSYFSALHITLLLPLPPSPLPPSQADPVRYKDLAVSFTNILTQVVTRKLPADFDYHGVPAPWIQIKLLRFENYYSQGFWPKLRPSLRSFYILQIGRCHEAEICAILLPLDVFLHGIIFPGFWPCWELMT